MSTLCCDDCLVDMRVRLTDPDDGYSIGPRNPAVGSQCECEGRVVSCNHHRIYVKWANGFSNDYKNNELSPLEGNDYISIW